MAKANLPHPAVTRARVLLAHGKTEQAIDVLEQAYRACEADDAIAGRLAILYVKSGRLEEAGEVIAVAKAQGRLSAGLAQSHIALLLAEQKPLAEIVSLLDEYVARLFGDAEFVRNAAYLYATALAAPRRGLDLMRRVLRDGVHEPSPDDREVACVAAWQAGEAKQVLEYALPLVAAGHPNVFLHHAVLRAAIDLGDAEQVEKLVTLYEAEWQKVPALVLVLADYWLDAQNPTRACELLRRAIEALPGAAEIQMMRAMLARLEAQAAL